MRSIHCYNKCFSSSCFGIYYDVRVTVLMIGLIFLRSFSCCTRRTTSPRAFLPAFQFRGTRFQLPCLPWESSRCYENLPFTFILRVSLSLEQLEDRRFGFLTNTLFFAASWLVLVLEEQGFSRFSTSIRLRPSDHVWGVHRVFASILNLLPEVSYFKRTWGVVSFYSALQLDGGVLCLQWLGGDSKDRILFRPFVGALAPIVPRVSLGASPSLELHVKDDFLV